MHIAFTLITAQVLGSIATILARAIAPNREGPGDVFPDFSFYSVGDPTDVFQKAWFYVGLISQIVICIGYFLFFRKVPFQDRISFSHFQDLKLTSRNNWRNHSLEIISASEAIFIFDAIIIICLVY
jgi:hypothetical protein